jgi:hypothetical protein
VSSRGLFLTGKKKKKKQKKALSGQAPVSSGKKTSIPTLIAGSTINPFSAEVGDMFDLDGIDVTGSTKRRLISRNIGFSIPNGPTLDFRTEVDSLTSGNRIEWTSKKAMPGVSYGTKWISLPVSPATTLLFWILLFDLFGLEPREMMKSAYTFSNGKRQDFSHYLFSLLMDNAVSLYERIGTDLVSGFKDQIVALLGNDFRPVPRSLKSNGPHLPAFTDEGDLEPSKCGDVEIGYSRWFCPSGSAEEYNLTSGCCTDKTRWENRDIDWIKWKFIVTNRKPKVVFPRMLTLEKHPINWLGNEADKVSL